MPPPGPEGVVKQTVCDAGTLCRNRSLAPRRLEAESEQPENSDEVLMRAAIAALQAVQLEMEKQAISLEVSDIGMYQGSEYEPSAKEKASDKAKAAKGKVEISETNCITLLKDAVVAYQDARLQPWGQITKRAEDDKDRGTTLLKEFRARARATTVYVVAPGDTHVAEARKFRLGPSKAPLTRGVHSKKMYDVRLPLDEFVSQKDAVAKLRDVPFGLGITVDVRGHLWGYHTFVYSYGSVYEVHWTEGPQSKNVFQKSLLEEFMAKWGTSVVLAVPPGPWKVGASGAPR